MNNSHKYHRLSAVHRCEASTSLPDHTACSVQQPTIHHVRTCNAPSETAARSLHAGGLSSGTILPLLPSTLPTTSLVRSLLPYLLRLARLTDMHRAHQSLQSNFRPTFCLGLAHWQQPCSDIPTTRAAPQSRQDFLPECGHVQHGTNISNNCQNLACGVAQHRGCVTS